MRDLTQQEIDSAPAWATHYYKGCNNTVRYESESLYIWIMDMKEHAPSNNPRGVDVSSKPIPRQQFDITKHEFSCSRLKNDTLDYHDHVHFYTPYNTAYINKQDAIALAKHFKLSEDDLK